MNLLGIGKGWYEDGARMAECFYGTDVTTIQRFWHPNGQLSAQGESFNGVRFGPWKHWFPSGVVSGAGEYVGGMRHGEWSFYREDGTLESHGDYDSGSRVGTWSRESSDGAQAER